MHLFRKIEVQDPKYEWKNRKYHGIRPYISEHGSASWSPLKRLNSKPQGAAAEQRSRPVTGQQDSEVGANIARIPRTHIKQQEWLKNCVGSKFL